MARTLKILVDWSRGGAGLPIPDSQHPNIRVILESMQAEIDGNRITITSPAATDLPSVITLANEIATKLNAVSSAASLVTFEPTPVGRQW